MSCIYSKSKIGVSKTTDKMQNENIKSSTPVSESELTGLGQNGVETTDRITGDDTYCDIKVYRQLRPLLTLMKIFGLYYKRCVDKYGNTRHERWLYYCLFILSINVFNVLRSFSVYRIGDHFNQPLVQKLLFTIWSTECALKAIIMIKSCYRQNGLPHFFEKWNTICHNAPLDRVCLLMMKKYMVATFLFLLANSLVFILVLQYVPVLNDIYLEVVWRGALKFGHAAVFNIYLGVFAVVLSTSSMLPVSLFVVLSCAVGKQLSKFKGDLKLSVREDDFHGKFEELRVRHQNLSLLIDILDRIFAPMIAACYFANIPMFCLVLYTMVTSTNIHISLVLINFFWLCFILLQMAIVSTTAAWVHSQVSSLPTCK